MTIHVIFAESGQKNGLAIEKFRSNDRKLYRRIKNIIQEHYVDVPEDKYDVIDELKCLDEMESKLDEVSKNMEISEERDTLVRQNVVRDAGEDLTESERKLESLSNGIDLHSEDAEKV